MKTKQKDVLTADTTLGQIFNRNSYAQELLRSIGFKPDGQTEKTLRQICSERQWSENEVLEWIGHHEEKERSEEHTSELQSRGHLVCRLLLEKKKKKKR